MTRILRGCSRGYLALFHGGSRGLWPLFHEGFKRVHGLYFKEVNHLFFMGVQGVRGLYFMRGSSGFVTSISRGSVTCFSWFKGVHGAYLMGSSCLWPDFIKVSRDYVALFHGGFKGSVACIS